MGRMTIITQSPRKLILTEKRWDRKLELWIVVRKEGNLVEKEILENQELHHHLAEVNNRVLASLEAWVCPDCRSTTFPHSNDVPCGFQKVEEI